MTMTSRETMRSTKEKYSKYPRYRYPWPNFGCAIKRFFDWSQFCPHLAVQFNSIMLPWRARNFVPTRGRVSFLNFNPILVRWRGRWDRDEGATGHAAMMITFTFLPNRVVALSHFFLLRLFSFILPVFLLAWSIESARDKMLRLLVGRDGSLLEINMEFFLEIIVWIFKQYTNITCKTRREIHFALYRSFFFWNMKNYNIMVLSACIYKITNWKL